MPSALARGDVVLTQFPFTDLTGSAVRPALLISRGAMGQDLVLAGISSVVRGSASPTDLAVSTTHAEFPLTGLRVNSNIRTHKLATVEQTVVLRRLSRIVPLLQAEVDRMLRSVLGL